MAGIATVAAREFWSVWIHAPFYHYAAVEGQLNFDQEQKLQADGWIELTDSSPSKIEAVKYAAGYGFYVPATVDWIPVEGSPL